MTDARQRLHRLSWVFITVGMIKELIFPLAAFLFFGHRQNNWELWGIVPLIAFVGVAIVRARAFSYQVGNGELLVRDGIFRRTERHIPFARIQNVSQRRKLLHRLLGVTELHLESAAGGKPEAVMRVLGLDAAAALEALLRSTEVRAAAASASAARWSTYRPR